MESPNEWALVGHSPARFGLKTLDLTTKSNFASTNDSDTKNKRHTALQETMAEPSESIESDTAEQSVEESVGYLRALIAAQTPKERNTFLATCRRVASNVKRTVEAEIETKWSWSKLARDDNWYHCRRLLQMLAHICEMRQADYEEYEMKLIMLLAAVECGSTEAVLWLVPLEGVLKELFSKFTCCAKTSTKKVKAHSRIVQELLRELTAFTHGVALNSLALRFHWKWQTGTYEKGPAVAMRVATEHRWYSMLYHFDLNCLNSECHRLLPEPREIEIDKRRSTYSIGISTR